MRRKLALYAAQNIKGGEIVDVLDSIVTHRNKPARIQVDNGRDISGIKFA